MHLNFHSDTQYKKGPVVIKEGYISVLSDCDGQT